jgi:hypothetical protein
MSIKFYNGEYDHTSRHRASPPRITITRAGQIRLSRGLMRLVPEMTHVRVGYDHDSDPQKLVIKFVREKNDGGKTYALSLVGGGATRNTRGNAQITARPFIKHVMGWDGRPTTQFDAIYDEGTRQIIARMEPVAPAGAGTQGRRTGRNAHSG